MDLLQSMNDYRHEASWALWELDGPGKLTGEQAFPLDQAQTTAHGRAMVVSLNPASNRASKTAENSSDWANFHSPDPRHNDIFLAKALVGTPLWGSYMTDLHPDIPESNSRLVRPRPKDIELSVRSLIRQAQLLGAVESIICVGKDSFRSVTRHLALIQQELGLQASAVLCIPHYSRSAAGVHKHDPTRYRALVHEAIGLA